MPTRNGRIRSLSLSLSILPYDRGPCVAVTAYVMMITMCLCILARLAAKLGRHRNSLLDSTFDLYSKGRERFSPKPCFKANSFPLAPIVQLCRSDSAYRCNNLCKGLFNYVHIRDIPVNKSLTRLPYPECHHPCLGAGLDSCSCGTV